MSSIETRYSNCGLCLVGDFNRLQTTRFRNNYNLKQIVHFPTRGKRTLDLVLTNLQDHYETPTQRPPLGLSDHMSIEVQPKARIKSNSSTTTIQSRDMRPSKRLAMRTYLEWVDLDTILNSADSCEDKTSLLEQIIKTGLDHVMPMRTRKVHSTEPPWITSSLKNLLQRRQSALSTKLGPWLFLVMINNLSVANTNIWKYADDTTLAECVEKNETSSMQSRVDKFVTKSRADGFQLNESKCKELRISFIKSENTLEPVTISNTNIEVVPSAKLLGVMISNDLKWNVHVEMIGKKAVARLYFLRQLQRAKVPANDLLSFYITCIRPVAEYACSVFHTALPQYLSDQLERLQKRALRMISTNDLSYRLEEVFNIPTLYHRREAIFN